MLTGKYERFQAVLVSNLCAWWSNVTAVLAIPTGVTPAGWRGEAKWKSSLDLWGARSGIPRLSWKWDELPTDAVLHNCLFLVWYSSAECKHGLKSIKHSLTHTHTHHADSGVCVCVGIPNSPPSRSHSYATDPLFRGANLYRDASFLCGIGTSKRGLISLSNKHRSFEMESFVPS